MDTSAIFKAYDVRGTYPDQLDEHVAEAVGSAFATFAASPRSSSRATCAPRASRSRTPSPRRASAAGVEVVDIGLASTDFLYFASGFLDVPGAMFTASHNPSAVQRHQVLPRRGKPSGSSRASRTWNA